MLKVDSIMKLLTFVLRVDSYYFSRDILSEVEETWIKIFGYVIYILQVFNRTNSL